MCSLLHLACTHVERPLLQVHVTSEMSAILSWDQNEYVTLSMSEYELHPSLVLVQAIPKAVQFANSHII